MDRPNSRDEFIHISLRVPTSIKRGLEKDAKRANTNFNSLASQILSKYLSFDKIAKHVSAIPINEYLFSGMLEDMPVDHLERLGKELGPKLIKRTFVFLDLEYDLDGLIHNYFDPMSSFSGWYTFTAAESESGRKLMFEHQYGLKWSAFLKTYISSIIKTATGTEPRTTMDDGLLIIYLGQ
jgi:hypothetical protein